MFHSFDHNQDITVRENTKLKSSLLPFEVGNMGSSYLSIDSEYNNRSNTNFPLHVVYQTITLWIYHVHPTRKKHAGKRLNLTLQYQFL